MPEPLITKGKIVLEGFDQADANNTGRPLYFNMDHYIQTIEQMICADELQNAIKLTELVPGWWRDNPHPELEEIKRTLYRQCYDVFDYSSDHDEANFTREEVIAQCLTGYTYPRADILFQDIAEMNKAGLSPWLFEISPSHGWLPIGFAARGLLFNFFGKNMNQAALTKFKAWLPMDVWQEHPKQNQTKILVCFEALEHMWNPNDLTRSAYKIGQHFDLIYLSTPKYTLGGGLPNWSTRRLGHVRTWTPKEFLDFASHSFPGYNWEYFDSHSMVIKGKSI